MRFGYDPEMKIIYMGEAAVLHNGIKSMFEFYYAPELKQIRVCHFGCNGTYVSGKEISETITTLPAEFSRAFLKIKSKQIQKIKRP